MITARQLMRADFLTCPANLSLQAVARRMRDAKCSSILVERDGEIVGIWTEHDALKVDFSSPQGFKVPVANVMNAPVITVRWDLSATELTARLLMSGIRHFLVVNDDDKPVGIVSQTDLVQTEGVDGLLKSRSVRSVLTSRPLVMAEQTSLTVATGRMRTERCDAAIIHHDDGTYGIVTERDVLRCVTERHGNGPVGEVASRPLMTVLADTSLHEARTILLERHIRHLGVCDGSGNVVGIITFGTILQSLHTQYLAQETERLELAVRERTRELELSRLEIISTLARAAEFRDNETGQHVSRMSQYCHLLAAAAGLDDTTCALILQASPMHDVGKIGIPDVILMKPGPLDPHEYAVMQTHAEIGARIMPGGGSPLLEMARTIAITHHERWDGGGYPRGLAGTDIPMEGRIAALGDVFDALTSCRPYKAAWPVADALSYIQENAGLAFDPALVRHFTAILPEIHAVMQAFPDAR